MPRMNIILNSMSIPIELRNDVKDIVHDRFPGSTVTWVDGGRDFIVMEIPESDYGITEDLDGKLLPVGEPEQGDLAVMSALEEKLQVFVRSKMRNPTNLTKIGNDARTFKRMRYGADFITKHILAHPDEYGDGLSYNQVYDIVTNMPSIECSSDKQMKSYRCDFCGVVVQANSQPSPSGCSGGWQGTYDRSPFTSRRTQHSWKSVRH